MKHVFLALVLASSLLAAGCSDSDVHVNTRAIPPLHYSQQASDLIDVSRFDARAAAGNPEDFKLADVVGKAGETLGAALDNDSRTRVLLKSKAAEGTKQLYTDNWLTKVAGETGIRTIMARLDATYESQLFALDDKAIYALPFRFMVIPDGESMVHVCMVDPAAYLSQFTPVSKEVRKKLQEAVAYFEPIIQAAFPDAVFDPRTDPQHLSGPSGIPPMLTLGQSPGTLDSVSAALEKGTFYYKNIAFKSGLDAYGDKDGADDADDIFMLYQDPANRPFIEIRGFLPFKPTFFDLKGASTQVPSKSDTMVFLVQNLFIHIFDADRRQTYDVNGKTIYQLLIYDGYIDPMLISSGVAHFAAVPENVFLSENNGMVTVEMQNPLYKLLRYYQNVTPAKLAQMQEHWNTAEPPNKWVWEDWTLEEMAEFSQNTAQKLFDAAMTAQ